MDWVAAELKPEISATFALCIVNYTASWAASRMCQSRLGSSTIACYVRGVRCSRLWGLSSCRSPVVAGILHRSQPATVPAQSASQRVVVVSLLHQYSSSAQPDTKNDLPAYLFNLCCCLPTSLLSLILPHHVFLLVRGRSTLIIINSFPCFANNFTEINAIQKCISKLIFNKILNCTKNIYKIHVKT